MYVRWSVRMEAPDAIASLGTVVMRLADQIGLSPTGLLLNGWQVSAAPAVEVAVDKPVRQLRAVATGQSARERMRARAVDVSAYDDEDA